MLAGHAACDPEAEQSTALVTELCELQAYLPFFSALLSNLPNKSREKKPTNPAHLLSLYRGLEGLGKVTFLCPVICKCVLCMPRYSSERCWSALSRWLNA